MEANSALERVEVEAEGMGVERVSGMEVGEAKEKEEVEEKMA